MLKKRLGKLVIRGVVLCLTHDWRRWNVATDTAVNLLPLNSPSDAAPVPASLPEKLGPAIGS